MAAKEANASDLYRSLIRYLVHARKKAGLSQRELAAQLGKRQSYVAKYETMERRLDVGEYVEAAQQLGLVYSVGPPGEPP